MCKSPKAPEPVAPPAPPPAAPPVLQQMAPATSDKNRREERSKRGLSRYKIENTQNKISSKYGASTTKSGSSLGGIPKKSGTG